MGCTRLFFNRQPKTRTAQGFEADFRLKKPVAEGFEADFRLKKPVAELTEAKPGFAGVCQGGAQ